MRRRFPDGVWPDSRVIGSNRTCIPAQFLFKRFIVAKKMSDTATPPPLSPPGLLRRLGAMAYDLLLLIAILMLLSYPYVWLTGGARPGLLVMTLYRIYLLAICFLFYGGFWVRGGQTLGMRTWRIKLVRSDGGPITWMIALKRFAFAWVSLLCLGLGFLWVLYDRDKLAWHDKLSGTRLIRLSKNQKATR